MPALKTKIDSVRGNFAPKQARADRRLRMPQSTDLDEEADEDPEPLKSCLFRSCPCTRSLAKQSTVEWQQWREERLRRPGVIAVSMPPPWKPETNTFKIRASAETSFCGSARRLWMLEFKPPVSVTTISVSSQIVILRRLMESATEGHRPQKGPWLWPVHNDGVGRAILAANSQPPRGQPFWRRVLWFLRMQSLPQDLNGDHDMIGDQFGSDVSYAFHWSNFYVQGLWVLMLSMLLFWLAGTRPEDLGSRRAPMWHLCQFWTLLWFKVFIDEGYKSPQSFVSMVRPSGASRERLEVPTGDVRIGRYSRQELREDRAQAKQREEVRRKKARSEQPLAKTRWQRGIHAARSQAAWHLKIQTLLQNTFGAVVSVLVVLPFVAVSALLIANFVNLNIYITYIWGRCVDQRVRKMAKKLGTECQDPEFVHGLVGWLAEVGSDIALALFFEVILASASKLPAKILLRIPGLWRWHEREFAGVLIKLIVEMLSKVGGFLIVGLAFVPRWYPLSKRNGVFQKDCQYFFDMFCVARGLEFDDRRMLFEKSVQGPFMVSPFVRILVKIVIPAVAGGLEDALTRDARDSTGGHSAFQLPQPSGSCLPLKLGVLKVATFLSRVAALIFHFDLDTVGGLAYLCRGWPWGAFHKPSTNSIDASEEVEEDAAREISAQEEGSASTSHPEPVPRAEELQQALVQVSRKAFEPLDELLDLRLSILFVTCCSPILPIGLVATLAARLLETHFKATKLLYIRRRCWPGKAESLLWTQGIFAHVTLIMAVCWHTGMAVVTYNPKLVDWGFGIVLGVWVATSVIVTAVLYLISWPVHRVWGVIRGRIVKNAVMGAQPQLKQHSQTSAKREASNEEVAAQPTDGCGVDRLRL